MISEIGVGSIIIAVAGYILRLIANFAAERAQRKRALAIVVGELMNIERHYRISFGDLSSRLGSPTQGLDLRMAQFGQLKSLKIDPSHLQGLASKEIAELMELSLLIRNNDLFLDFHNDGSPLDRAYFLRAYSVRIKETKAIVSRLLKSIGEHDSTMRSLATNAVKELDRALSEARPSVASTA